MSGFVLKSEKMIWVMLVLSLVLYGLDYLLYGRGGEIGFSFLGNLAFLPLYVLFVTLMVEKVLKQREREALRQKLNMVIGVFFSEVGTHLMGDGFRFVKDRDDLSAAMRITPHWQGEDFRRAADSLKRHELQIDSRGGDLDALHDFLVRQRQFMLGLMGNPNLLEHDEFTDLLWAVFHLIEELEARQNFIGLPEADLDHLSGDIKRAYVNLLRQWLVYMQHLKNDYPYLFSLAVRTNPLNPEARVVIG